MNENKNKRILVIDDEPGVRETLARALGKSGYLVDQAGNGREALEKVRLLLYNHIITDLSMPEMDGLTFLNEIKKQDLAINVIVHSAYTDMDNVVNAMKMGAVDFIAKPLHSLDQLLIILQKLEKNDQLKQENIQLRQEVKEKFTFAKMVAKSKKMADIFEIITKIADYKTTVLITGESGTGKELIAKAIHYHSNRAKERLVSINCGGIPETLLESELFGHVKGAFTDAHRGKKGLFEEASGGTLFLDEIGDLPFSLQVKLLRALQEEEIRPLGDTRSVKVDVRIITATAKNLHEEVINKRFRDDLFYRINVLSIEVPPLRDRKEDIPLLVNHFIKKYNKKLNLNVDIKNDFLQQLIEYNWPGNVRQLENVIERCMVLAENNILAVKNLPQELLQNRSQSFPEKFLPYDDYSIKKNSKILEKMLIQKALKKTTGNKTQAASILEISLPALLYKIKEYQVS